MVFVAYDLGQARRHLDQIDVPRRPSVQPLTFKLTMLMTRSLTGRRNTHGEHPHPRTPTDINYYFESQLLCFSDEQNYMHRHTCIIHGEGIGAVDIMSISWLRLCRKQDTMLLC